MTVAVDDGFSGGANFVRNRRTERRVGKNEATAREIHRRSRWTGRQIGRGKRGPDGRGWCFGDGNGLVQNILSRLFLRNLRLSRIGNLVTASCPRRDISVGEEQFAGVQAELFARPEDGVANAIGKVDFTGLGGAN